MQFSETTAPHATYPRQNYSQSKKRKKKQKKNALMNATVCLIYVIHVSFRRTVSLVLLRSCKHLEIWDAAPLVYTLTASVCLIVMSFTHKDVWFA